jgi:hypothetical protein
MVAAGVTRDLIGNRFTFRRCGLRHARQRVDLRENRDHWTVACPGARNECSGNAGDARLDLEPCLLELVLEKRGGLVLLIAELGSGPDLERDLRHSCGIGIDVFDQLRLVLVGKFRRPRQSLGSHSEGQRYDKFE